MDSGGDLAQEFGPVGFATGGRSYAGFSGVGGVGWTQGVIWRRSSAQFRRSRSGSNIGLRLRQDS